MRRLLAVAVLAVACSGSTGDEQSEVEVTAVPTRAPAWPEFWDQDFCYGLDQLGDAQGHIIEGSDLGANFDLDGAIEEAEQAAKDAREAQDAFEAADVWKPAHSSIVYLSSAAEELEKAANLLKLGVQAIDNSLLEEAVKHQEKAGYQIGRAQTATEILVEKYGAVC